jgi:hypothetical protein
MASQTQIFWRFSGGTLEGCHKLFAAVLGAHAARSSLLAPRSSLLAQPADFRHIMPVPPVFFRYFEKNGTPSPVFLLSSSIMTDHHRESFTGIKYF